MVLISIATSLITAVALILTLIQLKRNKKYLALDFIATVLSTFTTNKRLQKVFYEKFEYDTEKQFKFNAKKFHGSQEERDIDGLLCLFAIPAVAFERKQIDIEDLYHLEYYICRVVENSELQKYLNWHKKWLKQMSITEHPFLSLRQLSKVLIDKNPKLKALIQKEF